MSVTFVDLFKIAVSAAFIENILWPDILDSLHIGMSTNISNSLGMGCVFCYALSSIVT